MLACARLSLLSVTPVWSSALIALAVASQAATSPETQKRPYHTPLPPLVERLKGPASRYANLSPGECQRRLKQADPAGEMFARAGPTNGVATPLRVAGPISGVTFRVPPVKSTFGVLDCRQALLWIETAPIWAEHQIESIRIDNFYRNGARIRAGKKSQHAYGLAADIVAVTLKDGREVEVEQDFLGALGEPVCGPRARVVAPPGTTPDHLDKAIRLRNLVCDLARRGAFHHMLTPNYNAAHRDHLHFDLQRDNRWMSVD